MTQPKPPAPTRYTDADGNALTKAGTSTTTTTETYVTVNQEVRRQRQYQNVSGTVPEVQVVVPAGTKMSQAKWDELWASAVIDAITPNHGPNGTTTPVVITGKNFGGATGVTFGGTAGTAFTVVSDTKITVTAPSKTAGAVNVVVADDSGNATKNNGFTYDA